MFGSVQTLARKQQGSVMVETALCIPVLVIFFFGVLELGRSLIQLSWVQRTAYNSALLATYTQEAEVEEAVLARTRSLQNLTKFESCHDAYENCGASIAPGLTSGHYTEIYPGPETTRPTVRVSYDSDTLPMGTMLTTIGIDTSVVGPYLLSGLAINNPNSFSNPSTCVYGTCGQCSCPSGPPGLPLVRKPPRIRTFKAYEISVDPDGRVPVELFKAASPERSRP